MNSGKGQVATADAVAQRMAIEDVLKLHSRGLDRLDIECLKSAYWPEAEVDYGDFKGSAHVFADLVVGVLAETYELTRHRICNSLMDVEGDRARVETHVTAEHLLPGAQQEMVFSGRYLDTLERRDDCWKLIHRKVVMDWSREHTVVDERGSGMFAAMAKGSNGADDPLHSFPTSQVAG